MHIKSLETEVEEKTKILNAILEPLGFKAEPWIGTQHVVAVYEWNVFFTNPFKNWFGFAEAAMVIRPNFDDTMLTIIRNPGASEEIEKAIRELEAELQKRNIAASDAFFSNNQDSPSAK